MYWIGTFERVGLSQEMLSQKYTIQQNIIVKVMFWRPYIFQNVICDKENLSINSSGLIFKGSYNTGKSKLQTETGTKAFHLVPLQETFLENLLPLELFPLVYLLSPS